MIRYLLSTLALFALVGEMLPAAAFAADLDVRPYLMDRSRDEEAIAPAAVVRTAPTPHRNEATVPREPRGSALASAPDLRDAPAPHVVQAPTSSVAPRGAAPALPSTGRTTPAVQPREQVRTAQATAPAVIYVPAVARSSGFFAVVGELAGFAAIASFIGLCILILPACGRAIDRALAVDADPATDESPFDLNVSASAFDDAPAAPDLSAADIRKQTETMRAMKEALDAELAAVRAAMKHAPADAEQHTSKRKETS